MMTFTDLTSAATDHPVLSTDQLRLAVAAYLARFTGSSRQHTESVTRKAMIHNAITAQPDGPPDEAKLRLLHAHCHRQHARKHKSPALLPASEPLGLA